MNETEVTHEVVKATLPATRKQLIAPRTSATLYEMTNQLWRVVAREATAENLEDPAFYTVIAEKLRSFDRLAVITATDYFEVVVLYAQPGRPVLAKILARAPIPVVAETGQPDVPEGYEIRFDPATQLFRGVRKIDDWPITPPFAKWTDCFNELVGHPIFRNPRPNAST